MLQDISDLRGCSCAMADNSNVGTAGLIFKHLKTKGENPSFFGNTLCKICLEYFNYYII